MKSANNKKAIEVVEHFLQNNVDDAGKLNLSIMDIAKECHLSNASVWRSIKQLEKNNTVTILPSKQKAHPQTILFHGLKLHDLINDDISEILSELDQLQSDINSLKEKVSKTTARLYSLEKENLRLRRIIKENNKVTITPVFRE